MSVARTLLKALADLHDEEAENRAQVIYHQTHIDNANAANGRITEIRSEHIDVLMLRFPHLLDDKGEVDWAQVKEEHNVEPRSVMQKRLDAEVESTTSSD